MNGRYDVSKLKLLRDGLRCEVSAFGSDSPCAADARGVLAVAAECVSVANALVAAAVLRVDQTKAYEETGHRDTASFAAETAHVTKSEAAKNLWLARKLELLTDTKAAYERGLISKTQAILIAGAADDPEKEAELLALAFSDSAAVLAERAAQLRGSTAKDEADEDARKREARMCRVTKNRPDGMVSIFALLEPHMGARWYSELNARRDELFRARRAPCERESFDHNMADALMGILEDALTHAGGACSDSAQAGAGGRDAKGENVAKGGRRGSNRRKYQARILVDAAALRRGHRESGERCEIAGVGEISVATARELLGESMFRILVTDGVDVLSVTSKSRHWKAVVKEGIEFRDARCCVPGCDNTLWLEKDHHKRFSENGPTNYANGRQLCSFHHRLVTSQGYRLEGRPGKWRWIVPKAAKFEDSG